MDRGPKGPVFPSGLLNWAGHRSGGVRRLFYDASARPSGEIVRTRLISRLEAWAGAISESLPGTPRAIFLVGGPGNGKTEAIEFTIYQLDRALGLSGQLIAALQAQFVPSEGQPVPRIARIELSSVSGGRRHALLEVVQDASATDPVETSSSPAKLLVSDVASLLKDEGQTIYLACVNRGVLDDALVAAVDERDAAVGRALGAIVQSVGMTPDAPQCWPLAEFPSFAVWPMDVESLLEVGSEQDDAQSPARQLMANATEVDRWPLPNACPAGDRCPFCISRTLLSDEPHGSSLLRVLRLNELASGKRWSFRDLFSLISFLLAGTPPSDGSAVSYNPCEWAAHLLDPSQGSAKKEALRLSAPYRLVSAQYQHALFGQWPRAGLRAFRRDLAELQLQDEPALAGMYHFLSRSEGISIPPTLAAQLASLTYILDPGVADPDLEVEVSSKTTIKYRDIDTRFSQSVGEGYQFIQKYRCLSVLETDLLKRLDAADQRVSQADLFLRFPATAKRVQTVIRNFASRMVRRSLGVRTAVVRDALVLGDFQKVVGGDAMLMHEAAKQVESLLNERDKFVVTLNTTFGEPLPPLPRRAVLTTSKQVVKPRDLVAIDRPSSSIRFLRVGAGEKAQSIPLTYELFKSVRELRQGMMPASLPRPVVALLDTTRARLAGQIVRDEEALDGAEIRVGTKEDVIVRELGKFIVRRGDAS